MSFLLADMATQVAAARALYLAAARLRDAGRPFGAQAAKAKLFATDAAMRVTTDAVQVLGGAGYVEDHPVERWFREAKVLQIVEGTNQVQRLVIARALTSPPASADPDVVRGGGVSRTRERRPCSARTACRQARVSSVVAWSSWTRRPAAGRELTADGRASYTDLAERVGLSVSAAHQRVRRLEQRGVIRGYGARVDAGRARPAADRVRVGQADRRRRSRTTCRTGWPGCAAIEACHSVAGEESYILKVRVAGPGRAGVAAAGDPGQGERRHPHHGRAQHPVRGPPAARLSRCREGRTGRVRSC